MSSIGIDHYRDSVSAVVTTACLWEARARKIGNVHPGASFADLTYWDFETSAVVLGASFADKRSLQFRIFRAVMDTRRWVVKNTNLGIILLLSPLVGIEPRIHQLSNPPSGGEYELRKDLIDVLNGTTVEDADTVYVAIREASPGGLGTVGKQDIREDPTVTLLEAMTLARDRDMIARQYANGYEDVFELGVPALIAGYEKYNCVEAAVIHCQLSWMSVHPDSLIVRKNSKAAAETVRRWAEDVLLVGGLDTAEGRAAGVALDRHLRSDGNKLNPGTTADLVCACLFVALREGMIPLNAPFDWKVEDWL